MKGLNLLLACVSLIFFASCSSSKQGVIGKITEVTGNQMPGPGVELSAGAPLKTTVLITKAVAFDELAKNEQGLFIAPDEKLIVKRVETDAKGNFKVRLEPGVYSLLVKTPDGWFANIMDEHGVLNKITIERNEDVEKNIVVNYRAAF